MSDLEALARGAIATGFDGTELDASLPRFGGYLLFSRNCSTVEGVRALTDSLRARHGDGDLPPLIAIDQEGGRVMRLQSGVEPMPAMMALGATGDAVLAEHAGEQVAFDLRRAGCTMNLAPVLDLAVEPRNTVIGTRSFGGNPEAVATLAASYAKGLERGGVLACFKHFPGHGPTAVDSHESVPLIDADERTLRSRDLVPFERVAKRAAAIMGAHAIVRAFDAQNPATFSPRIAGELLRRELGFAGAYVTDCLEMGAVAEQGGTVASAVRALRAGADLLLVSHSVDLAEQAVAAIQRAVQDGSLALERLREANARVRRLRQAAQPPLDLDASPPHPGIGWEIAQRAITLVRGASRIDASATHALDFTLKMEFLGERTIFHLEASPATARSAQAPKPPGISCPYDPSADYVDSVLEDLRASKRRPLVLTYRAHLYPNQARAIRRVLAEHPDATVVSMAEPFDLALFPNARNVLAAYGTNDVSRTALAEVLSGGAPARGRLPVEIDRGR